MSGNEQDSPSLLSPIADHNSQHKPHRNYGENWVFNRNFPQPFTLKLTENRNELIKKSNNTYTSVEISNKTIGPHCSLSLDSHITHDPTAAHRKCHSKYGMGSNQCLNHHCIYKRDYKVWTNKYNTWTKSEKK